ncbi:hypothetical protein OsJ_09960 [Oryza sativa Japonica Group]|uniref:Uncharacterized protein n=1 Tax=Oryza sativa subsp. japonica TaxID=39947 RepID=B9F696_ORYSJ|nr:hypothetical protein OsJ_09960 [Oryza sativa Japonica Group]
MLGLVATGITGGALAQAALTKAAKPIKLGLLPLPSSEGEVLPAAVAASGGGGEGKGGEAVAGAGCWRHAMSRGRRRGWVRRRARAAGEEPRPAAGRRGGGLQGAGLRDQRRQPVGAETG